MSCTFEAIINMPWFGDHKNITRSYDMVATEQEGRSLFMIEI